MSIELGSAYGKIIIDAGEGMANVRQALNDVGKFGEKIGKVGTSLTTKVTLPLVGLGVAATKVGSDFESELAIMEVAARSSGTAIEDLSTAAIKMGADTELVGISAAESAAAMTNFYKAGLSTGDMFGDLNAYMEDNASLGGALRSAVDLAAASELDLGQASDTVAVAMATFGLEADEATRITNSFVQAADASVTDVGQLAEAMVNVGPTAASFGWSLEQTNTALAILSERGIAGSEAGTALKSMMVNLMRQTDDVTGTLDDLNVSLYNADGTMRALPDILADLEFGLQGATEEQRNLAVQTLAGSYGMKAMNTLLAEGSAGWNEMESAISSAATAQEVAGARTDTFAGAMEQLKGSMETLLIQVGVPLIQDFLRPAAEWFTKVAGSISANLSPGLTRLIIVLGGAAAAVGPLLIGMSKMLGAVSSIQSALATLGVSVSVSLGPLLAVAAALAAVAVAGYKVYEMNKQLEESTEEVTDAWGQFFRGWEEDGGSAIEIAKDYAETQAKVREELDKGGLVADLFIRNQDELTMATDRLNQALLKASPSQEDYIAAARAAGLVTAEEKEELLAAAAAGEAMGMSLKEVQQLEVMLSEAVLESHFAVVEQNKALAEGRETFESLNPEIMRARAYTRNLVAEQLSAPEAVAATRAALDDQAAAYGDNIEEMQAYTDAQRRASLAAQDAAEAAAEVYAGLAEDLAGPLGQMEEELDNHQAAMEALEADHATRMASLSPVGLKVEAEKAANAQLAAERRRILDELASLETGHLEKVQVYEAQGKESSIANENAAYEVKRANLETALTGLDGQYSTFYANQLVRLQANNAEEMTLEQQRYADEKAQLEASHAEQIAILQQQLVERLNIRTQELLLTGQITEDQANQLTAAMAKQFGVTVDETQLAVNHVLGLYQDWASGGETTATDIATSIGSIDTTMQDLEAKEKARLTEMVEVYDARARVYGDESVDFDAMVAAMEGSSGRMGDVRARFDELKVAIDNLPTTKEITVTARYKGDPELQPQSPMLAIQHMIMRAVDFAIDHPIVVKGFWEGLQSDVSRPVEQIEAELEAQRKTLAALDAEHAARVAELSPAGMQAEAERSAGERLADEKERLLEQLADLEAEHQLAVRRLQAQGDEESLAGEAEKFAEKKAQLEASLAELAGASDIYYQREMARLQAHNEGALALEEERYAAERLKAEAAHAERLADLKAEIAERLQARTQELLLAGELSEEQANQMTLALREQLGLSVDESALAINHILGLYQNWATGGQTAADDVATALKDLDTLMEYWEAQETERLQSLTGSLGELSQAFDALPDETKMDVIGEYHGDPELVAQSPMLAIQHMIENAVKFAARNPIQVNGSFAGDIVPPEIGPTMLPPVLPPSPFNMAVEGTLLNRLGKTQSPGPVTIYGGLTLQGVQDAPSLLEELRALGTG